jgi:hypothetical protein
MVDTDTIATKRPEESPVKLAKRDVQAERRFIISMSLAGAFVVVAVVPMLINFFFGWG